MSTTRGKSRVKEIKRESPNFFFLCSVTPTLDGGWFLGSSPLVHMRHTETRLSKGRARERERMKVRAGKDMASGFW